MRPTPLPSSFLKSITPNAISLFCLIGRTHLQDPRTLMSFVLLLLLESCSQTVRDKKIESILLHENLFARFKPTEIQTSSIIDHRRSSLRHGSLGAVGRVTSDEKDLANICHHERSDGRSVTSLLKRSGRPRSRCFSSGLRNKFHSIDESESELNEYQAGGFERCLPDKLEHGQFDGDDLYCDERQPKGETVHSVRPTRCESSSSTWFDL